MCWVQIKREIWGGFKKGVRLIFNTSYIPHASDREGEGEGLGSPVVQCDVEIDEIRRERGAKRKKEKKTRNPARFPIGNFFSSTTAYPTL